MKKLKLIIIFSLALLFLSIPALCRAMPPGTLVYRTSGQGIMYGYSSHEIMKDKHGILTNIYPGHVGIYIGQENGQDYVVEALSNGVVKTPLKYFVNSAAGEKFLGAKIPRTASSLQIAKAVTLAKTLVGKKLGYDLNFKHQKGPGDGQWTCVGLTEKLYESSNIANPNNLGALEYDPNYYAVDITHDGFDNYSVFNSEGDCFSRDKEFSKIARRPNLLLPAPELIGFDMGLEYQGERYFFLPYTQFLQPSLKTVSPDVQVSSSFKESEVQPGVNTKLLVLKWSLINNPVSTLKNIVYQAKEVAKNIGSKFFGQASLAEITLDNSQIKTSKSKDFSSSQEKKKSSSQQKTSSASIKSQSFKSSFSWPEVKISKAVGKIVSKKTSQTPSPSKSKVNTNSQLSASREARVVLKKDSEKVEENHKSTNASDLSQVSSSQSNNANLYPRTIIVSAPAPAPTITAPASTPPPDNYPKLAKISKIYASGDNDFIELVNITDRDFDLATINYRLEKTKSAENPSILMRIGNPADGAYPGGTVIKAHDRYLIVRDDANDYYRDQADAIATRSDFNWGSKGYTIYLGVGSISSSLDPDIVDALGFGSTAHFWQGSGPAPEIEDNYFLQRLADNGNNYSDFALSLSTDPEVLAALAAADLAASSSNSSSTEANDDDNLGANDNSNSSSSPDDLLATSTIDNSENASTTSDSNSDLASSTSDTIDDLNTDLASSTASSTSATSTSDVSDLDSNASSSPDLASSTEFNSTTTSSDIENPTLALINQVYASGDNDFIELYNPGDEDFNLASSSYRLQKTKSAENPSILMRFGNPLDGLYPEGTTIKAHDNYLIVRDDANDYYRAKADAIALRDDFTWRGSGYTFYLGIDTVSSSTDLDIQDILGFGSDANYWQGSGPAPEIPDNYILNRINFNSDNASDFNLILADDPSIILDPAPNPDLDLFIPPSPLFSDGLALLDHFETCSGPGHWAVGRWDCAQELNYTYDHLNYSLEPVLSANSLTLSFYYKKSSEFPRLDLKLNNDNPDDHILLIIDSGMITLEGLPHSEWRYYRNQVVFDDNWHRVSLVLNQAQDYWALYIDGQEIINQCFYANLPDFSNLEVFDNNGSALIDELALWKRALDPIEILNNYLVAAPYAPLAVQEPQLAANLIHSWNFEEDQGPIAVDSLSTSSLAVNPGLWVGRKHDNYALGLSSGINYSLNFNQDLISSDLSLSFWWRNLSYPNQGRTEIILEGGESNDQNILGLVVDNYRLNYWFNNQKGLISEGLDKIVPNDDLWHHLALIYDSYRYHLNFYVDGELKTSTALVPLDFGEKIKSLRISDNNFETAIDDLNIYQGALSATQIQKLYLDTQ